MDIWYFVIGCVLTSIFLYYSGKFFEQRKNEYPNSGSYSLICSAISAVIGILTWIMTNASVLAMFLLVSISFCAAICGAIQAQIDHNHKVVGRK